MLEQSSCIETLYKAFPTFVNKHYYHFKLVFPYHKLSRHTNMKAIKSVGKFSGDSDVERWIDRLELAAELDGTSDREAQLMAMLLDGPAYDMWHGLSAVDKRNAAAIKRALRNAFGLRRLDAWRAVCASRPHPGESLDAHAEQLRRWLATATAGGDSRDRACALVLMNSLPADVQTKVAMQLGDDLSLAAVLETAKSAFSSSEGAFSMAAAQEVCDCRRRTAKNMRDDAESEVVAAVERPARRSGAGMQRRQAETSTSTLSPGKSGQEAKRCYGCGVTGHLRKHCTAVCSKCGGERHMERFCWKSGNEPGEQ